MALWDILKGAGSYIMNEADKNRDRVLKDMARKNPDIKRELEKSNSARKRRTDEELSKKTPVPSKKPSSYQCITKIPLKVAAQSANNEPGVYLIYLNDRVMKCGKATYGQGVRWRFTQYYNLNYDSKSQHGDHWAINEANRDSVYVSWQCCPSWACKELEYKLFQKYGKGPWALRAPASCDTDDWKLLI